jgi:WD repeat-containing protein 76
MNTFSDYEKQRLENIKRNSDFLRSIGIDSVKPREVPRPVRQSSKPTRKRNIEPSSSVDVSGLRRSRRLSGTAEGKFDDDEEAQWAEVLTTAKFSLGGGAADLSRRNVAVQRNTFADDACPVSSLLIDDDGFRKVVKTRVTAVSMHPTTDKLIVFAGDKDGSIGVWDASSQADNVSCLSAL